MTRFCSLVCIVAVALLALPFFTGHSFAVDPSEILKDPKLEARARTLSAELRCLVCQNQSIDDSDAPLAKDLRVLVRERLTAGDSDEEVMKFVVSRYGDFVLLRPPFNAYTVFLWASPIVAFIIGGWLLFLLFRRRTDGNETAFSGKAPGLSDAEKTRLKTLLDGD